MSDRPMLTRPARPTTWIGQVYYRGHTGWLLWHDTDDTDEAIREAARIEATGARCKAVLGRADTIHTHPIGATR